MPRLSSNQLTVVIVTALLCLGLPAGALAAGVTKVAIVGKGGKAASVSNGRLQVSAQVAGVVPTAVQGTVPTTVQGTVPTTVQGTVPTTVQGQVTAQLGDPKTFRHGEAVVDDDDCHTIANTPAGSGLIVSQLRIDTFANPTPGTDQQLIVAVGTSPACVGSVVGTVHPPGLGLTVLPFEPALTLSPGQRLLIARTGSVQADVFADFALVPAAAVPALSQVSGATFRRAGG